MPILLQLPEPFGKMRRCPFFRTHCPPEHRWAIEMDGNSSSTSSKLLAGLCWVQAGTATAAALATLVEVESILGFFPAIAFLGLALALLAHKYTSLNLLLFGLSCPVATGMIALLIASFSWSPGQAAIPVLVILTLNAGVTCVWGALTARQITRTNSLETSVEKLRFQFGLRGLFGIVTLTCILSALFRQLDGDGEMFLFAVYGISVLVLSLAVSISFWYRVNRTKSEGADAQTTVIPEVNA